VVGFESRAEAERFLKEFRERLAKFGLELHAEKTRLIEFGRYAAPNREKRGEGTPETFTFLGFTVSDVQPAASADRAPSDSTARNIGASPARSG